MHKAKQFFFAGIISIQERRTAYEPKKIIKELNLLDKFLFDEAMDDPENVKTMLDIILSQKDESEASTADREGTKERLRIIGRSG